LEFPFCELVFLSGIHIELERAEAEIGWTQLTLHPEFDIQVEFPYQVRKRDTGRILASWRKDGYLCVSLGGQKFRHHRLIAEQFLPNPDHLTEVDHCNHVRDDNHISNLRWCSTSTNARNKSTHLGVRYVFDAELPEGSIIVDEYNEHRFTDYYYFDGMYWVFTGEAYRRLHINTAAGTGMRFVQLLDDDGIKRKISLAAYRRFIGEIQ
jgi:hypothetical protein